MKKDGKYKVLTQNTLLFTISNFGSKIITFLLVPLYTYVLNTEEYGIVDLLNSTANLLIPVITLNIQDAVLRFILDKEKDDKGVITCALKLIFGGSVFFAFILVGFSVLEVIKVDGIYVVFLFVQFLLGALNNCFIMYLKGKGKVSVLVISSLLNTLVTCIFSIVLLLLFDMGIIGYLIAINLGLLVADIISFFGGKVYIDIRMQRENALLKEMLQYSRPLIANSIAWWINNASDRYIVTFFGGIAANGIYSIAYKIPTIISTFQNVFSNAWSISAITEFDENDQDGFFGNTYVFYSSACMIICSLIMLGNILLAKILYSKEFFCAWKYVPFLLVGAFFNGIAHFQGSIFTAVKDTKSVSRTTIIGASVNTVCNFVFIYFFGALGASIATMLGYFVTWLLRTIKINKIIRIKVDWKCYTYSCILLVIQAILASNMKTIWFQLIAVLVLFILQRKYFVQLLRKGKLVLKKN